MKFFTFTCAVTISSLMGFALGEPIPQKRADNTPLGQIYAYGTNITGFPVFVGDGTAYIGNVSLSSISGAANVTFEEVGTSIVVHEKFDNGTTTSSSQYLAIDTTSGASEPVLVANSTVETGYTTDGYYIYGTQITWLTSTRSMESNFYALETDTDDLWELYWDADSSAGTKGVPVVLKAIGPPSTGRPSTSSS